MNKRYICILHRYPIHDALDTNPAMLEFLRRLSDSCVSVKYVSLKSRTPISVPFPNISSFEIPMTIQRSNGFAKMTQSFVYYCFIFILSLSFRNDKNLDFVYCDDSIPFLGFLVKIASGKSVVIRLGDLQTGYLLENRKPSIMFRAVHCLERKTWRKMDGLIPISPAFERYLVKCALNPRKIVMVPECVDTSLFAPKQSPKSSMAGQRTTRLIYHGVLEKSKGLDRILSYLSTFNHQNEIRIIVVGDGTIRKHLMQKFRKLVDARTLSFVGWRPLTEIPNYINSIDIGLVSREHTFSNSMIVTAGMLQYMSCARPVLVPDLESMEELVVRGECGLVWESEESFHSALAKLVESLQMRLIMGQRGRDIVVKEYSKEIVAAKLAIAVLSLGKKFV